MDCQGFNIWLMDQDEFDAPRINAARVHAQQCHSCRRLYEADQSIEAALKSGMQSVAPPPGLVAGARRRAEPRSTRQMLKTLAGSWKTVTPAMATAVLVLVFVWNPFSTTLRSMDELVSHGIANHLDTEMTMELATLDITNAVAWFSRRLGFHVNLPDLKKLGLSLIGGRRCRLGKIDAAYLFCTSNGKRASLFLINPDDISFVVTGDRRHSIKKGRFTVAVWEEGGMICVLVV